MSVRESDRKISSSDFVNVAAKIYMLTEQVYAKLHRNYKDFIGYGIRQDANKIIDCVAIINSVGSNSRTARSLYRKYLVIQECIGYVKSLDMHITFLYNLALQENGVEGLNNVLPAQQTMKDLGESLEREAQLLSGLLKNVNNKITNGLSHGFGKEREENDADYHYLPLIKSFLRWRDLQYADENGLLYDEETGHFIDN